LSGQEDSPAATKISLKGVAIMKTLGNYRRLAVAALAMALVLPTFRVTTARAQASSTSDAPAVVSPDQPGVPRLINFSGSVKDVLGKPVSGKVTVTLSLYEDQEGGAPLWSETQTVQADAQGHYTVLLGATQPEGLPQDLFTSTRARWLGVAPQLPGVGELPRVLLVGMPYALKASDADTLGGKPASAYVTTDILNEQTAASSALVQGSAQFQQPNAQPLTLSGSGTTDFIPLWTSGSKLGNSTLFQTGGKVGIGNKTPASTLDVTGGVTVRGDLELPSTGTATPTAGFNSQPSDWLASSFSSSTSKAVSQDFRWQAEAFGNNTASPSGTFNLLFGTNGANPAETGLSINDLGQITFASGQTFPGTGNGTITGITAGTGLTGGGASGNVTLNVNEGVVAFQTDLINAENTLNASISAAQTNAISTSESSANSTFLKDSGGTINGDVVIQGPAPGGTQPYPTLNVLGGSSQVGVGLPGAGINIAAGNGDFDDESGESGGSGGSVTLTSGSGGNSQNESGGNAGQIVMQLGGGGTGFFGNGSPGQVLIVGDDNGQTRATPHQVQIQGHTNPNKQLLIGYLADSGSDVGYGALQATDDGTANTPLVLNPNGGGVGIQTTTVTNSLTIGQGQGPAVADGWNTYSSRRWKTNIKTLPDALDKVERLRGVSYDLKANGKHEIGVIAEEVGAVVPEIVEWDKNGKDAEGVDYSRLTALLIEAVKQQQREIRAQQAEIARARHELHRQQALLRTQGVTVKSLQAQVRAMNVSLEKIGSPAASAEPRLVAAR
jgi:hypothetical protein